MPNEFSPRNLAQPLKPRDAKRLRRNTLPPVERAALWPVDNEAMWRERWRKLAIFDVCMVFVLGVIFTLLILAIVTLPSAGQAWRF